MTREDMRALRELANAAVDPDAPPPVMNEAYGALLLKLIEEHETPWTDAHWTDYERAIVAAERKKHDALRDAAQQALAWLQAEQSAADADCGDPACDECDAIVRPRQRIIDALRETLK